MNSQTQGLMERDVQGHWIRLETLTRVRWLAAAGQVIALLVARFVFDLSFALELCLVVVGVSAISNLVSAVLHPRSKRLSELELLLTLLFDIMQLTLLLYLTGGLNNPFALLLIAPVTIAATAQTLRGTLLLGGITIVLASVLAISFEPLRTQAGHPLLLPDLFRFGFWLSLVIGIAFIGLYSRSVAAEKHSLAEALMAMQLTLAREQKLTDLGGVIAAAAHELGTPLATIKLVSSELSDALSDMPDLADDARLIRDETNRCREILRSMGQAGKDDRQMHQAPLEAIIAEAASPHTDRGKHIHILCDIKDDADTDPMALMPEITRRPEIIYGLRNLIQNAVDFAQSVVWIEARWDKDAIHIRVTDDGPGYPAHLLSRIGEPYLRERRSDVQSANRKEYEGMGLGLFIAKTLLERTGANVRFANCDGKKLPQGFDGEKCGAQARVRWMRSVVETSARKPLGENLRFRDHVSAKENRDT